MRILLDTSEFLWLLSGDSRLDAKVTAAIRDRSNEVFLSVVSFWEISLKHALGKLPLPQPPAEFIPAQRDLHFIAPLNLDESAVACLSRLPSFHRDPFDRMLVCQALSASLTLATSDPWIRRYPVALL